MQGLAQGSMGQDKGRTTHRTACATYLKVGAVRDEVREVPPGLELGVDLQAVCIVGVVRVRDRQDGGAIGVSDPTTP